MSVPGAFAGKPQADRATLNLRQARASIRTGATLTIAIRVAAKNINAVEADLTYPSSLLAFSHASVDNAAWGVTAEVNGGGGNVKIAVGSATPRSGELLVAKVTFTAVSAGLAKVEFSASSAAVDASTNRNILAETRGGRYTITGNAPRPAPAPSPSPTPPAQPPSSCNGTLVVNVTWHVSNGAEAALVGNGGAPYYWATWSGTEYLKFWQAGSNSFCGYFGGQDTFTTVAGRSPDGTGTVPAGLTGSSTWQYTAVYNRIFDPQLPTNGDLGVFNENCVISPDHANALCASTPPLGPGAYFRLLSSTNSTNLGIVSEQYAEIDKASNGTTMTVSGTWANNVEQSSAIHGDITG